jgi:hypothetical protein
MRKADYKFNRDKRNEINDNAKQNENVLYLRSWHSPIYIPKRKKKK